ncbi:MAG: pyruvate kinase [Desulfomonilaceae bacterium]
MKLPAHKTKIVCTIGPASNSVEVLEGMIRAGMNVARLNFSHEDLAAHKDRIASIRKASEAAGMPVAIMADLPGPKMRIGELADEPIELEMGTTFTLTTADIVGDETRASVSFALLPSVVKKGDALFLNDGLIQLKVLEVAGPEVRCRVLVGGELRSRKGLNLPGIELGMSAFTDRDQECLRFAVEQGIDAVSQSFVESAKDIQAVRDAVAALDGDLLIIAKIERSRALDQMDDILQAADGIMVARGDLGVEVPIERIAVLQKQLIQKANVLGKPVITATQMLESMTRNRRPTRAESTDVANAILDGTDCVMLSEESAMGRYPVECVAMLARIAEAVEPGRTYFPARQALTERDRSGDTGLADLVALGVLTVVERVTPDVVIVPTRSGRTARILSRYKLPAWITSVSSQKATCQKLLFSYGVWPIHEPDHPHNWKAYARSWLESHGIEPHLVILTEGPSSKYPDTNNRMEIIDMSR